MSGVNLGSLQNLTGMNQLYNMLPQMGAAGALSPSSLGLTTDPPAEGEAGEEQPLDEESLYFIKQLQGMVYDAVLDSIQDAADIQADSIMKADIFGHQFFRLKNLNVFDKSARVKAPANYVLDEGDEISVAVWGAAVFNESFEVEADGYVYLEDAGRVYVKGLTFGAVREVLTRKINSFINLRNSNLEINLNYSRTITVNIVGDVMQPGSYVIPAINSVFNALSAANGPSSIGSIRNIAVKRDGATVKTFDLYQFLLDGEIKNDFFLQEGDYIYVPTQEKVVEIDGSIRRPWKYEAKGNETLADLLMMAGGFTANSYTEAVQLRRYTNNEVELMDIALSSVSGGSDIVLKDGDKFYVPQIPADYKNFVEVQGYVRFPGQYQFKDGYRISDAIEAAGGLLFDTYLDRAYITRRNEDLTTNIQNFPLKSVVIDGSSPDDILLQRGDKIEIFSKQDFLEEFKVTIEGAVLKPVNMTYSDGMTLNDLVFYAGGLKKEAANNTLEVSRVATKIEDGEEVLTRVVVLNTKISADLELDADSKGFELSPMDQVYVRKNPEFDKQSNITIEGEVVFPGTYPILQKDEKILDLIERAGGLTDYAYLQSARLYRLNSKIGVVVIDLEEAYRSPNSRANYILKAGDVIDIPTINQMVSVRGAIGHPDLDSLETISSYYVPGKRAKYYIKSFAGGFDTHAKKKTTKVVNPDGSAGFTKKVLGFNRYPAVEEGAVVSVGYNVKRMERKKMKEESTKEPLNWNILLPSVVVGATSVISSTILILLLNDNGN